MSGQDMGYRDFWGLTVHGMLARLAERYGDRPLFTWRRGGAIHAVTYGEFFRDVRRLAARLAALGLQGKSVVIDMRNSYEQVAALFAASSMGAVAAPLSFDLPLEDLQDLIGRIGPELLICDELDLELVPELQLPEGCALLPCLEGADSAAGVLAGDGPLCQETEGISPDDPALLLATSGSTSRSKLVLLSHYGLTPHWELMRCGRVLHVLPLHHVAALWCLSAYMALGSEICLSDLGRGAADLAWFRPTDLFAVPAFVSLLVRQSRTGRLDLSGLRSISSGGAPQNLETVAYLNGLGIFSMSLYGATETAGAVDYSAPAHYRFGSVGRVGPWNQVRFSSRGEILVKGKNVMLGYLNDPEATDRAMEDGWYHTGDVGYLDADGFLFITGRIKNVIILSNGENVSPEAIEGKLGRCPAIAEVIVRGEDDRIAAEIWCGERDGEELRAQARDFVARYNRTVPSYQAVRRIHFRDAAFAKTASGKLKR